MRSYGDRRRLTPEIHEHCLRAVGTPGDRLDCATLPGQILGATPWLGGLRAQRAALAEKLALIVWGMRDIAFREKGLNRWIEALPQAQVARLSAVGHYLQDEAPDEVNAAVRRFLGAAG